jgi:soluble lytic murein transglycosylase-like protein
MRKTKQFLAIGMIALFSLTDNVFAQDIPGLVSKKATEHNVPVAFAQAIVKVESNFDPKKRGKLGEWGLGQIRCGTAKAMGFKGDCKKLAEPETNLEYSIKYMKLALEKAANDYCGAANYYSSGYSCKPNKSSYCKKVLATMQVYARIE